MLFHYIVVSIAILVLILLLVAVYYNDKSNPSVMQIPGALTTCPDYWEATPDGKCIIPSKNAPNANLGNLRNYGEVVIANRFPKTTIYTKSSAPIPESYENIYRINGYPVYVYNTDYRGYEIPAGYPKMQSGDDVNVFLSKIVENGNAIDFKDPAWAQSSSRICDIKKWVNRNNIVWDGIQQYNQCIATDE